MSLILLGLSAQVVQAQPVTPLSVDEQFYSVLNGHDSSFKPGETPWVQELNRVLALSTKGNKPTSAELDAAQKKFAPPSTDNASIESIRIDLVAAYRKFRLENPESQWFRTTGLNGHIEKLRAALAPTEDCAPNSNIRQIEAIVEQAASPSPAPTQPTEPSKGQAMAWQFIRNPSLLDDWKKNWSTRRAIEFARYLHANDIHLSEADLSIISRQQSGLVSPTGSMTVMPKIEYIVIHHTATDQALNLRNVQRDHMSRPVKAKNPNGPKWSDIGPHFFVMRAKENGPWGFYAARDPWFQGAHAPPNPDFNDSPGNPNSIGIETAGLYVDEPPEPEVLLRVYSLIRTINNSESGLVKSITNSDRGGVQTQVQIQGIRGHLECSGKNHTVCPGAAFLPIVEEWDRLMFPENRERFNRLQSERGQR